MDKPAASPPSPFDRVLGHFAASMQIPDGSTILFQGDSITDCGRDRANASDTGDGYGYGYGYVSVIASRLAMRNIVCMNRGVSGNRIADLEARWTEDCIALQPDIVSIQIGINDTWRRYDSGLTSDVPEFEACYRRLLDRVKNETSAWPILVEPFVLETSPDRAEWRQDLDPRIHAIRRIALDYGAAYVPLDGHFASLAACAGGAGGWAEDGVHPTRAGHSMIAMKWIEVAGLSAAHWRGQSAVTRR